MFSTMVMVVLFFRLIERIHLAVNEKERTSDMAMEILA